MITYIISLLSIINIWIKGFFSKHKPEYITTEDGDIITSEDNEKLVK